MRILLLAHYALPHVGGIEIVLDELARCFQQRGHEVAVVASSARGAGSPPTAGRVVRVPALNTPEERLGVPWPIFSPRLVPVLRREIARTDVVHAHGLLYMSSLLGLVLATRAKHQPVRILTEHVGHVAYANPVLDRVESGALSTLGRVTAHAAEQIIVLNDDVAAFMGRLAPHRAVHRIDNGLDLDRYRPADQDEYAGLRAAYGWEDRPIVLFVGRLVAKKGIEAVLAAARAAPELRFVVVSPGGRPPDAAGNVHHLGTVTRDELRMLYRAADAFLLPSYGEGFSLAAQEAMASGVPVVLREGQGHRRLADEARPGVIEAPPEGVAIAAALRALLGDPVAHAAARAAVRNLAERRFSMRTWTDAHLALYASAAADSRLTGPVRA
jgi:D-inositol-3-phosphate glycosyltransferase